MVKFIFSSQMTFDQEQTLSSGVVKVEETPLRCVFQESHILTVKLSFITHCIYKLINLFCQCAYIFNQRLGWRKYQTDR